MQQGVRGWAPEGKLASRCCREKPRSVLHDASSLASAVIVSLKWLSHNAQGKKVFPGEPVSVLYPSPVHESRLGRPGIPQCVFGEGFLHSVSEFEICQFVAEST